MLLSAKKINKSYQDNNVLQDVNLDIKSGDSICISGENGSGKSTLLKIFCGLLRPDIGTLSVLGRDPYKQPENLFIKQRMGVLMHSNMLYPQLTVKENLLFFSKLLGIIKYRSRVCEVTDELNISKFLNIEIYKLSNGNRRKASFAKSLLNDPEILITDEPEANIDVGCIYGPSFISIYDVPEDQGGYVFLNWNANSLDVLPDEYAATPETYRSSVELKG